MKTADWSYNGKVMFIKRTFIFYLDAMSYWLISQLLEDILKVVFQQEGAPAHLKSEVFSNSVLYYVAKIKICDFFEFCTADCIHSPSQEIGCQGYSVY